MSEGLFFKKEPGMERGMNGYVGYVFILLAATFWGLIGPVARFALESGISPAELGFWRAALAGFFFLLHSAAKRDLRVRSTRDMLTFMLFGVFCLGGFFVSNLYAIQTGGAALAAVLLYTAPAWVAVFSRIFFLEPVTLAKVAAIAVSLAGVTLISLSGTSAVSSGVPIKGVFFGLLAGLLYSANYIFSKKYLTFYSSSTLYGYCMAFAALSQLPLIVFASKTPADWLVLFTLGFICTYGAYLAYCAGVRRLEATKAAVLATFEPVIATGAAWWIWQESFAPSGWIGAALILAAVLVMILGSPKAPRPENA